MKTGYPRYILATLCPVLSQDALQCTARPARPALTYRHLSDMSRHMRTTVRLDDALIAQAKREARRQGETLTALIERGLRLVLAQGTSGPRRTRVRLPVSREGGGVLPGVDLDNSAALLDIMEGRK